MEQCRCTKGYDHSYHHWPLSDVYCLGMCRERNWRTYQTFRLAVDQRVLARRHHYRPLCLGDTRQRGRGTVALSRCVCAVLYRLCRRGRARTRDGSGLPASHSLDSPGPHECGLRHWHCGVYPARRLPSLYAGAAYTRHCGRSHDWRNHYGGTVAVIGVCHHQRTACPWAIHPNGARGYCPHGCRCHCTVYHRGHTGGCAD